jgi:hypothetical protein
MTRDEILKAFIGITDINEAKKIYKGLARKLHPDVGGDEEEFKLLGTVYQELLKKGFATEGNESAINIELEKIIAEILHFEDIVIEVVGDWIWVYGDTKPIKEELKSLGFKWAKVKQKWYLGEMKAKNSKPKSMDEIKSKYGCKTVHSGSTKLSA